jgi:3-dehydroquinate synthase
VKQLRLTGSSGESLVAIGESIERLEAYCHGAKTVIVSDGPVRTLHGHRFPPFPVIEIGAGEKSKTLRTVEEVYASFFRLDVDRSSSVVAIGGGIVCDVAGFAASTYLRGLSFGFVPTTLLSQVDASVGGKNGVNLEDYKNLIGTFTQPGFVLCDFDLLRTLPAPELINGLAEVVKQAVISDPLFFAFLEENWKGALSLSPEVIERIVYDSLRIKTAIVSRDEKESGERRKLNFGHTIGHALEKVHHFKHGEAVSMGMVAAARLSASKGLLSGSDVERLETLLINLGLPVRTVIDSAAVIDALKKDKKRVDNVIHFVLLDAIGSATIAPLGIREIEEVIDDLRQPR